MRVTKLVVYSTTLYHSIIWYVGIEYQGSVDCSIRVFQVHSVCSVE